MKQPRFKHPNSEMILKFAKWVADGHKHFQVRGTRPAKPAKFEPWEKTEIAHSFVFTDQCEIRLDPDHEKEDLIPHKNSDLLMKFASWMADGFLCFKYKNKETGEWEETHRYLALDFVLNHDEIEILPVS